MDREKKKTIPNIPRQVRDSLNAKFEKKEKLQKAAEYVPELYGTGEKDELPSRKGTWDIYKQQEYRPPLFVSPEENKPCGRFCALYKREGKVRTIIRGNTADTGLIRTSLLGISKYIIEQRPVVSRPGRVLTEENGMAQGIKVGLIFAVLLAAFVLFDYVLIPNYPEAFLQAADITRGEQVGAYSSDAAIYSYQSFTGRIMQRFFPEAAGTFSTSIYTLLAVFILPVLGFGIVYEAAGKGADRRRMKRLPEEALGFSCGLEAADELDAEYEQMVREGRKRELYNRLKPHGLTLGKKEFEDIYSKVLL